MGVPGILLTSPLCRRPPPAQTCAHRYEARHRVRQPLETRDVIGRCFVLSQDLRVRDELDGGEWKFCQGRPQGHDRFGSCQQGLAAAFSPDHHYVLFGAPGTYNWKGEVWGLRGFTWPCVWARVPGGEGVRGCARRVCKRRVGVCAVCELVIGVSTRV